MMAKVEWAVKEALYGPHGKQAMLGKFAVGYVSWNHFRKDEPRYDACLALPGYKNRLGKFETEAEAMSRVESAVSSWVQKAGLEAKEQTEAKP
jgi:hypothetical protein